MALIGEDGDVVARERFAQGASTDLGVAPVRHQDPGFGLSVGVMDRDSEHNAKRIDRFGVERRPGRDCVTNTPDVELMEFGVFCHPAVLRRRLAENGGADATDQIESFLHVECALVHRDLGTDRPGADQGIPHKRRATRFGGAPDEIVRSCTEPVLGL